MSEWSSGWLVGYCRDAVVVGGVLMVVMVLVTVMVMIMVVIVVVITTADGLEQLVSARSYLDQKKKSMSVIFPN